MIQIEEMSARLEDERALAKLLASTPHPPSVEALLKRSFFSRRWDQRTRCDYWLASNGQSVLCLKISGADAGQVAQIRSRFDGLRAKDPAIVLSRALLRELVAKVAA